MNNGKHKHKSSICLSIKHIELYIVTYTLTQIFMQVTVHPTKAHTHTITASSYTIFEAVEPSYNQYETRITLNTAKDMEG